MELVNDDAKTAETKHGEPLESAESGAKMARARFLWINAYNKIVNRTDEVSHAWIRVSPSKAIADEFFYLIACMQKYGSSGYLCFLVTGSA